VNVLSLFDGMSSGQIALERAGVDFDNYYASEIDKYAIKVTQENYPDTIQLGDVKSIDEKVINEIGKIDLLIGGSPCQNLSKAVINRKNYNQGLDGKDSKLFYDYVRILDLIKEDNPNVLFLLENVASMSEEDKKIITETLNVEPIMINSNLVSAQDRKRYYWTNIKVNGLPKDRGIVLEDVMLTKAEVDFRHNNSRMNFWYDEDFEYHGEDKKVIATLDINGYDILKRVYNPKGKCGTLTTCTGGNRQKKVFQDGRCRKLTPLEYERLQTVPEGYTDVKGVSNTRRYNMLGNGWTVDVIKHIFSFI